MLKKKLGFILVLVLLTLICVNVSYAMIEEKVEDENIFQNTPAVIIKDNGIVNSENGMDEMSSGRIQNVVVEVLSGEKRGTKYNATYTVMAKEGEPFEYDILQEGDKVYLTIDERMEEPMVYISGIQRHNSLILLAIIFLFSILLVGKKQGLKTIISLAITIGIMFFWTLPAIINGASPVWTAILASSVITIISYVLISGFHKKTLAAAIGTVGGWICGAGGAYSRDVSSNQADVFKPRQDRFIPQTPVHGGHSAGPHFGPRSMERN